MIKKLHGISKRKLLLFGMAIISICAVLFYILYCTKSLFHSDMAYWLLWSDEQIKTHQFYPDGFHYTTGVPTLSPGLIVLLLRLVCQNWLLCREIAVIIMFAAVLITVFFFYKSTLPGRAGYIAAFLSIILLCIPMMHYKETFYEAAYIYQILWDAFLMLAIHKLFSMPYDTPSGEKRKKHFFMYCLWFILMFLISLLGTKSLFLFTLPIIIAIPIFVFIENNFHFEAVFKNKRYNIILILSVLGTILGAGTYFFISGKVLLDSATGYIVYAGPEQLAGNVKKFIVNITNFYSAVGTGELISIGGITSCLNLVLMFICTIIAPVWMILRYRKTENKFWRFYTIYALLSNFFLIYTMIFTTASVAHYYEPAFWHNIVFTSVFVIDIIKSKDKYYEGFIYISLAVLVICGHVSYIVDTVVPIHNEYVAEETEGTLIDFLKENDLNYGFASFWHAYKYMALSNGEITLASYIINPVTPYYWMTSESYYDVEAHPGRCFLLVSTDELPIAEKYVYAASEFKEFKDYIILVYEKNIFLYDELLEDAASGNAFSLSEDGEAQDEASQNVSEAEEVKAD